MDVTVFRETYQEFQAKTPSRGSDEAAGFDLYAFLPQHPRGEVELHPLMVTKIPTGFFMAQPVGGVSFACCRSGLAAKGVHIVNSPGVVDSDYRGEVVVLLTYIAPPAPHVGSTPYVIKHGDRVGQLVFLDEEGRFTTNVVFSDVATLADLPASGRGAKGFGSTGA